jgi:hypothetical protein
MNWRSFSVSVVGSFIGLSIWWMVATVFHGPSLWRPFDESGAQFFVNLAFKDFGWAPVGAKWEPYDRIAIAVWAEPIGPDAVSDSWKEILTMDVDKDGYFGFDPVPKQIAYAVSKNICGHAKPSQTIGFRARNQTTGVVRLCWIGNPNLDYAYYTGQPCP